MGIFALSTIPVTIIVLPTFVSSSVYHSQLHHEIGLFSKVSLVQVDKIEKVSIRVIFVIKCFRNIIF